MPRISMFLLGCLMACQTQTAPKAQNAQCSDIFASGSDEGRPLATIGEQVISVESMEKKINSMTPFVRARYKSKERRKEYVEHLMDKALMAQEALRRKLHQDGKVIDHLQTSLAQELSKIIIAERTNFDAIDEAQAKTYYDEHYDDYHKPGAVRISHIYKTFAGNKAKAKSELESVHVTIKAGIKKDRGLFRKQASLASDDESTKAIGGDLRYLTEKQLQERFGDALAKAVWNLPKINTMTDVVEGKEGWHIFRLTGRRHAHSQDFKDVKEQIRHRIYRKQRRDVMKSFLEELRSSTTFSLDESALEAIKIAAPKPGEAKPPMGVRNPHGMAPGARRPNIQKRKPFGHGNGHGHSHGRKILTNPPDNAPKKGSK